MKATYKDDKFIIPIKVGDTNETSEIGIDELGQPTINGNPIFKFRVPKYM